MFPALWIGQAALVLTAVRLLVMYYPRCVLIGRTILSSELAPLHVNASPPKHTTERRAQNPEDSPRANNTLFALISVHPPTHESTTGRPFSRCFHARPTGRLFVFACPRCCSRLLVAGLAVCVRLFLQKCVVVLVGSPLFR